MQDGDIHRWHFERDGRRKSFSVRGDLTINDPRLAVWAAVDGIGLAYTVERLAEPFLRTGRLVRILPDWVPRIEALYLYYQGRRQSPAALKVLIDMVRTPNSRGHHGVVGSLER